MKRIPKVLLVAVGALALAWVEACTSGTELNPQPLPPAEPSGSQTGDNDPSNGTSGSGFGATPPGTEDAGVAKVDAGDAGTDGGDD